MNSWDLRNLLKDSGWEYSEGQYEAMAEKLRNLDPYNLSAVFLEFRTAPTPEKLVNAIFNNKPKEKKQYCGKCESGYITVAKLENIPRGIEKAPILYPNGRMICPFCQGKNVFLNYIRKAVDNQRMPQVIAYLDVKEQLETFLPVMREVISQTDFEHYYKQSRALWAGQVSPKATELIRRAFCQF